MPCHVRAFTGGSFEAALQRTSCIVYLPRMGAARAGTACTGLAGRLSAIRIAPIPLHRLPPAFTHEASRRRGRGKQVISAAIFGVGAPEALLVGVVALVVFGPKGLAQAVKSLGATLRTFSPTIREIASVTNDLSSTLQQQIGLDEIRNEFRNPAPTYRSLPEGSTEKVSTSSDGESQDKVDGPSKAEGPTKADGSERTDGSPKPDDAASAQSETEEELAAKIAQSKTLAWGGEAPPGAQSVSKEEVKDVAERVTRQGQKAADLSIEELEAEIKRRREASKA